MEETPDRPVHRWGLRLVVAGIVLLALWAALEFTALGRKEEPAAPGRTPNPSAAPWNKAVPDWEYSLSRGLVVLFDGVLPGAGLLSLTIGLALQLGSLRGGRTAPTLLGALLLLAGLSLIGFTVWQWRVRTAAEPAAVAGRTPADDPDSPFFMEFEKMTPQQIEARSNAYWEKMTRQSRLERLWGRAVLYAFPPVGLVLSAVGVWLLTSRPVPGGDLLRRA